MANQLETTVHQWLRLMGITIAKEYLRQRLLSHPDFPSALSITGVLDELGIENGVAQIEDAQWSEIPLPCLAFVDNENFVIVKDINNISHEINDFSDRWNGIVVFAERPEKIVESPELTVANANARSIRVKWMTLISTFVLLSTVAFFYLPSSLSIILITAAVGLIVSSSIVLRELGIANVVSKKLCGEGQNTGCDAALHASLSTLPLEIKLSDIGVSFFAGIVMLLLTGSFAANGFQKVAELVVTVACLASVPFTLFSIYFQWRVTKQWCVSCLFVIATLWVMIMVQSQYRFETAQVKLLTTVGAMGIFILPGAVWLLVRHLLNQNQKLIHTNILLQRFYRHPDLLKVYLFTQEKIDVTPLPCDFQIGNASAECQIIVVSSPFCGPCSETHDILQSLLKKHKDQIGITVRYSTNHVEKESRNGKVIRQMVQYALANKAFLQDPESVERMLATWYTVMDIQKFSVLYPVAVDTDVNAILKQQRDWRKSVNIHFTPTIIVNGYKLESPYSQTDLFELSSSLIDIFSSTESVPEVYA